MPLVLSYSHHSIRGMNHPEIPEPECGAVAGYTPIELAPVTPIDGPRLLRWNLPYVLPPPVPLDPSLEPPLPQAPVSRACLRLFGLLRDGSPWECVLTHDRLVRDGGVTIGRDPSKADIELPDLSISRCHLRLELTEQGLVVTDEQSTNGTALDGNALSPYERRRPLHDSSVICPGDLMLCAEILTL